MNNNDWLDIDVLEDYLDGKLDAKAMHRVERLSLEDPFVAEALAGLSLSPKRVQSLSLLQKQLKDRIAQKPVQEKRWQITSQRLSIAAAAAVLFVAVSLLFWMRESNNREQLVANTPKKVEVAIADTKELAKPAVKPNEEIEKVITEAKENTYVTNSKKLAERHAKSVLTPLVAAAPSASIADPSEGVSLRTIEIEAKKELLSKQAPSALAGKVAGIQVNRNSIQGAVYGEDGLPIQGASVKFKGTAQGTTTDRKGHFSLSLDSMLKDAKLNVTSIGFMPKEVNVKKDENLSVQLNQSNDALNEVVIIGYGTAKKQISVGSSTVIVESVEPLGGWDKFEEYMLNNNKMVVDKKQTGRDIMVSFKINEKGEPINIKIVNNIIPRPTKAEEKEAFRLLKDGPKWILPAKSNTSTHTVNIRF